MSNLPVPSEGTATVGVPLTAAFWNTNVRDAINFLLNPPLCVCYAGAVQSIPNGAWTALQFNTNRVDSYSGHSTTTNNSRYVGPVPGWYDVSGIGVAGTATVNNWAARLAVDGSPILGSANNGPAYGGAATASARTGLDVYLNGTGDYVEIQVSQSSGASMNTAASGVDYASSMRVRWVHA